MDKVGLPRGLVRYSTENAMQQKLDHKSIMSHIIRPRILLYTAILILISIIAGYFLVHRIPLKVDIIRDRSTLAREADDGSIENVFMLQIMNTSESPQHYKLTVEGLEGLKIVGDDSVDAKAAGLTSFNVVLAAPPESGKQGSNPIHFTITAEGNPDITLREKASFLLP